MLRARSWTARFIGLVAATIAAGLSSSTPARAIGGGSPAPDDSYPFVVKLDIGDRSCTAALIDPQWVITASTCFAADPRQGHTIPAGPPKQPTTATIGRASLSDTTGYVINVIHLVPRPDRNLVLAKLARRVTDITPVKIATTPPAVGEVLRVAGYGRTTTEWVPDQLHTATFSVQTVTHATLGITGKAPPDASTCKGDAGGPAFRDNEGRVELVAVSSTSWQRGCFGETETRQGVTETRADDLTDWIQKNTRELPPEDFDGDGKSDILAYDTTGETLWMIPNTSSVGHPSRGSAIHVSAGWRTVKDQSLADYDGDGMTDIIGRVGDELRVWRNNSTVGHPSHVRDGDILGTGWNRFSKMALADFDGDGKIDILAYDTTGENLWMIPNTSSIGHPSRGNGIHVSAGWRTVKGLMVADYDGDGMTDIIGRVGGEVRLGELRVWRNNSTVGHPSHVRDSDTLGMRWHRLHRVALTDFDGDGKIDILTYDTGETLWMTPNTSSVGHPSGGDSFQLSSGWRTVKDPMVADYDGDGMTDIIGRVGDELRVWRNNSTVGHPSHARDGDTLGTGWNRFGKLLTQGARRASGP